MATAEAHTPVGTPQKRSGLWDWLTTIDHKKIGILYASTALVFFVLGGLEALLIRWQLARPEAAIIDPDLYNQLFTMHGLTMVFLVGMPIAVAFFNYVVPLQIGARNVAFPRLNAFSYWIFLFGGLFMYSSWFIGAAPDGGWFGYANLSSRQFSPGPNMDFYALGLQILGIGSIAGGVNFITTIVNLRAPGMKLMRMPLFTWMALVTSFIIVTALPVLAVALFMLTFDRFWDTNFFNVAAGGDPILWQHLFWLFGHPEVYILILPAFGIASDVIPTFSQKPLFGYAIMVFSGALIGFISWGVWSHHMFTTGLGPIADSFFTISTMIIAIPTGVKIFNWLATMWGGAIKFTTSMMFAIAMVALFTIGGISGIMHSASPADLQQHDTYFVVAHFHYVLIGGLIMGVFSGFYYWYPKVTGRLLSETLGKWHFWLFVIGFNAVFMPMHWVGLLGMPRRVYTYAEELGVGRVDGRRGLLCTQADARGSPRRVARQTPQSASAPSAPSATPASSTPSPAPSSTACGAAPRTSNASSCAGGPPDDRHTWPPVLLLRRENDDGRRNRLPPPRSHSLRGAVRRIPRSAVGETSVGFRDDQ